MNDADNRPAVVGQVERPVRPPLEYATAAALYLAARRGERRFMLHYHGQEPRQITGIGLGDGCVWVEAGRMLPVHIRAADTEGAAMSDQPTDRALLERAAKAAGYTVDARASFRTWREYRKLAIINPQGGHTLWNAEDDDGNALRLAVELGLVVDCSRPSAGAPYQQHAIWLDETCDNGTLTRRAIVRAAAAMAGEG